MTQMACVSQEYAKNTNIKKEDVENLMDWVEKQPHLPKISELQAILFLHSSHYSNEKAKKSIEIFFTVRTLCEELFRNSDINDPGIILSSEVCFQNFLPKPLPNGNRIVIIKIVDTNADNYSYANQLRVFDMIVLLHTHLEGTIDGVNLVYDLENLSFAHLLRINPVLNSKFLYYMQEGLPIRMKEIYLINAPSWVDRLVTMFKPFLKKEVFESIRVFKDLQSFFEVVPQEFLPSDYGGKDVDSMEVLAEATMNLIRENAEFFKAQEKQLTDESKRLDKKEVQNNMFGVDGTFKKLALD